MTIVRREGRAPTRTGRTLSSLVLVVLTLLTSLWSYASPAVALAPPQATTCDGVWVVVDYGALGKSTLTDCAAYATGMTGLAALKALKGVAAPSLDAGMVVRIGGLPAAPNIQENYWSYWHATRQADGSYSAWSYSNVGPSSYHPTPGQAEGWRYAPARGAYVAPGVTPPKQTATAQAPATAAPPTTATKATKATTGAPATAVSAPTRPPSVTTGSDTPSAASSTTEGETPGGTPSTEPASGLTIAPSAAPTNTSANSLVGGVVAIAVIGLGAVGLLLWRRRTGART